MATLEYTDLDFSQQKTWDKHSFTRGRALITTIETELQLMTIPPQNILRVLYINSLRGRWITRKDIATALDKPRLYPYQCELLEQFVSNNWLDREKRPRPMTVKNKPSGYDYYYRVKPAVLWCMRHISEKRPA